MCVWTATRCVACMPLHTGVRAGAASGRQATTASQRPASAVHARSLHVLLQRPFDTLLQRPCNVMQLAYYACTSLNAMPPLQSFWATSREEGRLGYSGEWSHWELQQQEAAQPQTDCSLPAKACVCPPWLCLPAPRLWQCSPQPPQQPPPGFMHRSQRCVLPQA